VKTLNGTGSNWFASLASQYKDAQGRYLPKLVKSLTKKEISQFDKIYLAAFSAGWGLLNVITQNNQDLKRIDGLFLHDAAFGGPHNGFIKYAKSGKLMVITSTNNSANPQLGIMKTGRESVMDILNAAGLKLHSAVNIQDIPRPSGGIKTNGKVYWFDYVKHGSKNNQGNDFSHVEHHHLAPKFWNLFIIKKFSQSSNLSFLLIGSVICVGIWIWSQNYE